MRLKYPLSVRSCIKATVYADGRESTVTYGDPITTSETTTETSTNTWSEEISRVEVNNDDHDDHDDDNDHDGDVDDIHENNGWGNGDQDAPGNSDDHNNAENSGNDIYDGGLFNFDIADIIELEDDYKLDQKADFDTPTILFAGDDDDVEVDVKGKDWKKEGEVEHNGEGYTVYSSKDGGTVAVETDLL